MIQNSGNLQFCLVRQFDFSANILITIQSQNSFASNKTGQLFEREAGHIVTNSLKYFPLGGS